MNAWEPIKLTALSAAMVVIWPLLNSMSASPEELHIAVQHNGRAEASGRTDIEGRLRGRQAVEMDGSEGGAVEIVRLAALIVVGTVSTLF